MGERTESTKQISFTLDGETVTAGADETLWQVAKRVGTDIPHLCYRDETGYRSDGNCRACMVEIEGERVLAPSCQRKPAQDMVVHSASARAEKARKMVMELLLSDMPAKEHAHDDQASFWRWAEHVGVESSRYAPRENKSASHEDKSASDLSHPAMAVNLDACIQCTLCVRACRDVQVNDVIGMAGRGFDSHIVFDMDDPMGQSTCVACGECVQACPTGALMPKSIVDMANQKGSRASEEKVHSVCPYCGVGCQLTFHLKDEKIAYVEGREGPANENRLCVKGRFGFDYIDNPQRLTKPLIRLEGAEKGLNIDPANPLTHFREASWEEALDLAANGLLNAVQQHGNGAIAGFGSAKCSNEEAYLFQKMIRSAFGQNNVDHCTRLCHASSVAALMEGVGSGAVTASFNEALNADVIVLIGSNATENHPVAATYFKQAVKNGAELIVMDPRGHQMARHATQMVQFRPGSDVAMLNAIMHVIIEEKMYDVQYIQAHTEEFERLKQHVKDFTPEDMAPICGIDADKLRELAHIYGRAERAMIFWGMGVSQHVHGTDNARCLISLALMCGQVGRSGTGLHPLRGQNNVQGASDAGLIPMLFPDYLPVGDDKVRAHLSDLWQADLSDKPGLTVVEIINAAYEGKIAAMAIMGENPAMSDPDAEHARAALAKLEHLVVQDIFLTETAMLADVVLPATAWPEKNGTVTNTNRQVQMGRKAVKAPGEAKEDWWITQEMARRLGLNWNYESPKDVFAEMKQAMPSLDNITWERVERESSVTYPCKAPDQPGEVVVFGDAFPRSNGRALFAPAFVTPPAEIPDEDYPFILTTGRQLEHWHTGAMTRRSYVLDALEPEATASIHPDSLAQLSIEAGQKVRLRTRRGAIELLVRADAGVQRDVVFVPFAFVEASANVLTNPQLDPYGKIPEFKYCAVKIEALEAVS